MRDRATGTEMVLVMPGESLMGSPESEPGRNADEGPQHRVRLTQAFYLGVTEVTQLQWKRSMGSVLKFFKGDSKPVEASWVGAQAFWVEANANGFEATKSLRLPTEAEWDCACRAGTTGPFGFEGPISHSLVNFNDGVARSMVVADGKVEVEWEASPPAGYRLTPTAAGSLPPNAWGLHDMHGNLLEWCDEV